jgi:RNA polymerase nonessential primary-like sigma factor
MAIRYINPKKDREDGIKAYIKNVSSKYFKLLTPEEEIEYGRNIQKYNFIRECLEHLETSENPGVVGVQTKKFSAHTRKQTSTRHHPKAYVCTLDDKTLQDLVDVRWIVISPEVFLSMYAWIVILKVLPPKIVIPFIDKIKNRTKIKIYRDPLGSPEKIISARGEYKGSAEIPCNEHSKFLDTVSLIEEILEVDSVDEMRKLIIDGAISYDKLTTNNLKLCISVGARYSQHSSYGSELADMIQEGNIGLLESCNKFSPGHGYKFSTYGFWWIRQSIARANGQSTRAIRLPSHIIEKLNVKRRITKELTAELGRAPTVEEIYEVALKEVNDYNVTKSKRRKKSRLFSSPEAVRNVSIYDRPILSTDQYVLKEDGDTTLGEMIADESQDVSGEIAKTQLSVQLRKILEQKFKKKSRQYDVLLMRFGLTDGKMYKYKELGTLFNVSGETIRQDFTNAMECLRNDEQIMEKLKELMLLIEED